MIRGKYQREMKSESQQQRWIASVMVRVQEHRRNEEILDEAKVEPTIVTVTMKRKLSREDRKWNISEKLAR